jgi:hypothetical protein
VNALLLAFALFGAARATDPADDPRPYEEATRALLNGPPGCRQVRGEGRLDLVFVRPGGWTGPGETVKSSAAGPFLWTIRDGLWDATPAKLVSIGDGPDLKLENLLPVIGTTGDGEERGEEGGEISVSKDKDGKSTIDVSGESQRALSIVDQVLEEVAAEATLSWVEPAADGGKVLFQRAIVKGAPRDEPLEIRTRFDAEGGATAVDILFPKRVRIEADEFIGKPVLLDAQVHVRAQRTPDGPVVTRESASFVIGLFGFTLGVDQALTYTGTRPCPG